MTTIARPPKPNGSCADDAYKRRLVAYHEAGHAVASTAFAGQLISFTIGSRHERRAFNGHSCATPIATGTIEGARTRMIVLAAGSEAEKLIHRSHATTRVGIGAEHDRSSMYDLARKIHGLRAPRSFIDAEIKLAHVNAARLLRRYEAHVHRIAAMFLKNHDVLDGIETLTDDDILELTSAATGKATPMPTAPETNPRHRAKAETINDVEDLFYDEVDRETDKALADFATELNGSPAQTKD